MSAPSTSLESLLADDLIDVKRELTPALLQQLSFFRSAHLSTAALASLIQVLGHRYLSIGDNVFRQGDPSTEFYVVLSGRVQFYREFLNSRERTLGAVNTGDGFGELGLLSGKPRATSARATTACHLLFLNAEAFTSRFAVFCEERNQNISSRRSTSGVSSASSRSARTPVSS